MIESIRDFLSSLTGVITVASVKNQDIPEIRAAEGGNEHTQIVRLVNLGVRQVLRREFIFVFIKDARFRPPPCPTLYMVEDAGNRAKDRFAGDAARFLETDGEWYHIVGEEVISTKTAYNEDHFFFQKDFVMFPKRRSRDRSVPAYFLLPPVPFPELEAEKKTFGITNIISISPSALCDDFLRERYHLSASPEYATILVGLDSINRQV